MATDPNRVNMSIRRDIAAHLKALADESGLRQTEFMDRLLLEVLSQDTLRLRRDEVVIRPSAIPPLEKPVVPRKPGRPRKK